MPSVPAQIDRDYGAHNTSPMGLLDEGRNQHQRNIEAAESAARLASAPLMERAFRPDWLPELVAALRHSGISPSRIWAATDLKFEHKPAGHFRNETYHNVYTLRPLTTGWIVRAGFTRWDKFDREWRQDYSDSCISEEGIMGSGTIPGKVRARYTETSRSVTTITEYRPAPANEFLALVNPHPQADITRPLAAAMVYAASCGHAKGDGPGMVRFDLGRIGDAS